MRFITSLHRNDHLFLTWLELIKLILGLEVRSGPLIVKRGY